MVVGHAEQQRFEATVSRVRVDVIVQDREGGFVDDLTVDDFRTVSYTHQTLPTILLV